MIVLFGLIYFFISFIGCENDTLLFGYENTDVSDYGYDAPLGKSGIWKAVQVLARATGKIQYFKLWICGFTNPPSNSVEVGWALYDNWDDQGTERVGAKICEEYESNYDFRDVGLNDVYHKFNATNGDCNIVQGNKYWMTYHNSEMNNTLLARGRVVLCDSAVSKRWGSNLDGYMQYSPPDPSIFINSFAEGCYAWSGWSSNATFQYPEGNVTDNNTTNSNTTNNNTTNNNTDNSGNKNNTDNDNPLEDLGFYLITGGVIFFIVASVLIVILAVVVLILVLGKKVDETHIKVQEKEMDNKM